MAHVSRRDFLKAGVAAGVAIKVSYISPRAQARLIETPPRPGPDWLKPDGRPRYRLDAIAKVTGEKTFARDYRARDLEGWPKEQSHAFLLHATKADRIFEGIDLTVLGDDLKPDRLVLQEDLVADGVAVPVPGNFYGDVFLVPKGETARLLGQPVALLVYHDFARYDAAKRLLRFDDTVVRYGAKAPYSHPPHYGAARYVRIDGGDPAAEDRYSPLKDAVIYGGFSGDDPAWPAAGDGDAMARGMTAAAEIEKDIAGAGQDALVLRHEYFSQSVDASAMEADNGNVWYDPATGILHAMIATQSPYEVAEVSAVLVSKSKFKLSQVDLKAGYTVGYGTKDHSIFPFFCVVAALYGDGRPVRLANDRYEQFQMGLKRHAFWMDNVLVIDRASHKIRAMTGRFKNDGGGRANFSFSVGFVGATAAQSIYYLPKSDFSAAAIASRAVDAGSTRGYGTLQSMSATEMMIDEAAELLGVDAIDLRLKNVFRSGMKNTQGAIPAGALRNEEILLKARQHPLWRERAAKEAFEAANPGKLYGIGYGHVQKDYGTGAEAALASIEFDAAGRLSFAHVAHEIGTGTTTSQAIMVGDILGRVPDDTHFAKVVWPQMPLETTEEPYTMSQADEDQRKQNPRWTPSFTSPMSATNSVYYLGHATREAARALLDLAIWPAALALWSRGIGGGPIAPYTVRREELGLAWGMVNAGGMPPLSFADVAAEAHRQGLVTGVTVHSFNRWQWAEADFDIPGAGRHRFPFDALALKYGDGAPAERKALMTLDGWQFVERASVSYPPTQRNNAGVTYYAPMATLAEVVVDTGSGDVTLLSHHSIMECGTQVVPELVSGQIQGGIAMGVGHALKEYLPLYEDGPGDGTWNWNRYELPRAKDVAVWSQTAEVLDPLSETDAPKGIAEVVMIAIVPAIANAVAHATGKRFYAFPITAERIREALA